MRHDIFRSRFWCIVLQLILLYPVSPYVSLCLCVYVSGKLSPLRVQKQLFHKWLHNK